MIDAAAATGEWFWHVRHATPCRVVDRQSAWGELAYSVWLPTKDVVLRARPNELADLDERVPTQESILHAAAAARLADAMEDNLLLAPVQSSVVPLPHQLYALNRAMSRPRVRYLLADEVGLGKTIEAGLILRELKLRGMARRILVVAPKGLVRQWQAEMRLHFGETFHFVEPAQLAAYRPWRSEEENLWRAQDQVICSLDSVKPLEGRRGWGVEQLASYNRERFEDLVSAQWDLVIIDESHRMGGSTEQVARYKLGAALAEASPYLLLLSATPHQGKTDQFMRLMQLIDRDSFLDESSVQQDRVRPFVIRTEKRAAIDAEGRPLFKPRMTRLFPVAWQSRHAAQHRLYEAVTNYVRHGYNQALIAQQRHIGFLMILMQRLVTSSTAAIRTTLEKRLSVLEAPPAPQLEFDDWEELDGQAQVELAVQAGGWEQEKAEVAMLLELARETESAGTDAKAESLVDLIYKLQQDENDPALKVLVFTEFVPTQAMLTRFMESRGFSVVQLNGAMDLEARTHAQREFAGNARILISTDAGGEGLNLQFCHVIVNFDMPWNPMRLEQRIGRVDRIGQPHVVRAFNFVLDDTVEHRVREVLEDKLAVIAEEFGVDKASDVMDSAESEQMFERLFAKGLQDPDSIERGCAEVVEQVREQVAKSREHSELLADQHDLKPDDARKWRDHPAQFWLERAVVNGLPSREGAAVRTGSEWTIRWADGTESRNACFDGRTAERRPELEWITMEDARARAIVRELPRFVPGMPLPLVQVEGLPPTVNGVWSLWEIRLSSANGGRRRYQPVFVAGDGRSFAPTARRIWDLLVTAQVRLMETTRDADGAAYKAAMAAAEAQGESLFATMLEEHKDHLSQELGRLKQAFDARSQAIGRIGLPAVREYRRKRLEQEHASEMARIADADTVVSELYPVLMMRVGTGETP